MLKWPYTTPAGVPYKSTGSTNGQGTTGTFQRQLLHHSSNDKTNKIVPDLVIRSTHLSGSSGVDCVLDSADHIVGFKTLQGTRTRTNTKPNDTEANAAGRSGNARALRKTKQVLNNSRGGGALATSLAKSEVFVGVALSAEQ